MLVFGINTLDTLQDPSPFYFASRLGSTLDVKGFNLIRDPDALNAWLQKSLVPALYSSNFEAAGTWNASGAPNDELRPATGWLIQGPVRVAQLRSQVEPCPAVPDMQDTYPFECTRSRRMSGGEGGAFSEAHENRSDFRGFTYEAEGVEPVAFQRTHLKYSDYETKVVYHTFPAPAFAVLLHPHKPQRDAQAAVDNLVSNHYIDRRTNAVFIDLSVHNYFLLYTAWTRLACEFNGAGGVFCRADIIPVQLYWAPANQAFKITANVLVALGYSYFAFIILFKIKKLGYKEVLKKPLTWTQIVNILFYLVQLRFRYESYSLASGDGFLSEWGVGRVDYFTQSFLDFRPPVCSRDYRLGLGNKPHNNREARPY